MNKHNFVDENQQHLLKLLPQLHNNITLDKFKDPPSYATLMQWFGQVLNDFESNLLNKALASQISIIPLTRSDYYQLTHLIHLNYIIPFGKNRYYIPPELLNDYNLYCLNHSYQPLPLFKPYVRDKLKFLAEAEIHCRSYETMCFSDCLLEHFDTKQLQELCALIQIANYHTLSNQEKCERISHKVLNSYALFEQLFKYLPMLKILFSMMIIEDRNSFLGAEIDTDKSNLFFLFSQTDYNLVYVPIDLFEHIKRYFKLKGIDATAFLCHSIHQFTGKQLKREDEQKLVKGLCQNKMNRFLADTLLSELTKDILFEDILDCAALELHDLFFVSLVSLYGFVPLTIVSQLYNRYFNKDETPASLKQVVSPAHDKIYCVTNTHLVFTGIRNCYKELDQQYRQIPYYMPNTLEELFEIISMPYYMQNEQFKSNYHYLCQHYHDEQANSEDEKYKNTVIASMLLPLLALVHNKDNFAALIQKWFAKHKFKGTSISLISKSVLIIYNQLHLWSLRGHTTQSYKTLLSQNHATPAPINSDNDI